MAKREEWNGNSPEAPISYLSDVHTPEPAMVNIGQKNFFFHPLFSFFPVISSSFPRIVPPKEKRVIFSPSFSQLLRLSQPRGLLLSSHPRPPPLRHQQEVPRGPGREGHRGDGSRGGRPRPLRRHGRVGGPGEYVEVGVGGGVGPGSKRSVFLLSSNCLVSSVD